MTKAQAFWSQNIHSQIPLKTNKQNSQQVGKIKPKMSF